jgi:hypothetical protein
MDAGSKWRASRNSVEVRVGDQVAGKLLLRAGA